MRRTVRIAWLLLGLLALAGAIHAPLHADGQPCSPAGLCSGVLLPGVPIAVAAWILVTAAVATLRPVAAPAPRDQRPRLTVRGRAPPRI